MIQKYEIIDFFKKVLSYILTIFIVMGFIWLCKSDNNNSIPTSAIVSFDEIDELIELASNRDRDYNEILDEIVARLNEIKEQEIDTYKDMQMEGFDKEMERQW